jgi:hypothetical protein
VALFSAKLVNCRTCKQSVAKSAAVCPQCGCDHPGDTLGDRVDRNLGALALLLFLLVLGGFAFPPFGAVLLYGVGYVASLFSQ